MHLIYIPFEYLNKVGFGWSVDGDGISKIEYSKGRLTSTRAPLMEKVESMRWTNLAAATNPPSKMLRQQRISTYIHKYTHIII